MHNMWDSSLFIYKKGVHNVHNAYLLLYVDDIILTESSSQLLTHLIFIHNTKISMAGLVDLN